VAQGISEDAGKDEESDQLDRSWVNDEKELSEPCVLPFCHPPEVKTLTIKVPETLFAEIAGAAKARNVPKSEIVRERLARKPITSKRASLWSSMEDLVIEEDALPTDLSSNRKHLKGYGKNRPHR
jgi:hypothetical protein